MMGSSNEQNSFNPEELGSEELWRKIRALTNNFPSKPFTQAGEQVYNSVLNEKVLPLFQNYPQLSSLLSVLIYLYEVERGAALSQSDFFADQQNQLVLLKAFSYFAEGELKQENYFQYQKIFETLLMGIRNLEKLARQQPLPNILNSLTISLNAAIHTIPEASSINIKPDGIRKFLAERTQLNDQYQTVFENFQTALVQNSSDKK